jgi:hypothetical protein
VAASNPLAKPMGRAGIEPATLGLKVAAGVSRVFPLVGENP